MDRPYRKQRYYFDLVDGENISFDGEGMELPDIQAAQQEAVEALAALTKELRSVRTTNLPWTLSVEVRDSAGVVLKVQFAFETRQLQ